MHHGRHQQFMIDHPFPSDWRQLQAGVCRLFNEVGLTADVEVTLSTPRGSVTVDVHAVDENSVDRIQYLVECKNWSTAIPQTVVHAFTTVMHETGANLGFIVSQHGLQAGAHGYTDNTNIQGLTYLELQQRYLQPWWEKHFCVVLGDAGDKLMAYVEPFNGYRDEIAGVELNDDRLALFHEKVRKYQAFGMYTSFFNMGRYVNLRESTLGGPARDGVKTIPELVAVFAQLLGGEFSSEATTMRAFLDETVEFIGQRTKEFHDLFGRDIFEGR